MIRRNHLHQRFQYTLSYGAPSSKNSAENVNYMSSTTHSGLSTARMGSTSSLPMQMQVPEVGMGGRSERALTLTQGSDPDAVVALYDTSNKLIGGLNAQQFKPNQQKTNKFSGTGDIKRVQVWVDGIGRSLDLRQAQGWLNVVQHLGVTVGFDGSGKLIGSLSNMNAIQNIYPDRDGVTLNTKCTYMLNPTNTEGTLYCS